MGRAAVHHCWKAAFAFAVFSLAVAASAGERTGSWGVRGPAGSGKWLKALHEGNSVRFQLELSRGAPSYNSGWLEGEFELKGNTGTFRSEDGACEILFTFRPAAVRLSYVEDRNACGFGHNVWADGTLRRTSRKPPKFSTGDPRTGPN